MTVVGVSYDSPETNRGWAEKNQLPFRLLTDSDRLLAKQVGAARALLPLPKRVSYLVGTDGLILATYPDVDPSTHAAEVLADLDRLGVGTDGP